MKTTILKKGILLSGVVLFLTSCGGWSDEDRTKSINACVEKHKESMKGIGVSSIDDYEDDFLEACKCTQEKIEANYSDPAALKKSDGMDVMEWRDECFDKEAFMKKVIGL